jgi:hypothetical protein
MMVQKKYLIYGLHSYNKIESGKYIHLFEFSFLIFIYMPFNC